MRCRYCGADNPEGEPRCVKCQRRMLLGASGFEHSGYAVVDTATAPALNSEAELDEAPLHARFATLLGNRDAKYSLPAKQQALFSHRQPQRVVEMEGYSSPTDPEVAHRLADPLKTETRRTHRRKVSNKQDSFDFAAPVRPSQPFTREIDRSLLPFRVAPLGRRAVASVLDLALILGLTIGFLGVVRVGLGQLPLDLATIVYFAPAPLLIGLAYKLLFAICGRTTIGLQSAELHLVSHDGQRPTIQQRVVRVFAGLLSLAGGGLGLLWSLADEETLTWHDMMTQTFLTSGERVEQGR